MANIIASGYETLRLVNESELTPSERDEAIWRSIWDHDEIESHEGVHNPEIWAKIQNPKPADVFVRDMVTNKLSVAPTLGFISLLAS